MHIIETVLLSTDQKEVILSLWNNEYPANLSYAGLEDFDNYLSELKAPKHYLLLNNNRIQGWAFTFVRNEERWFAIIVHSFAQRSGYGTMLLDHIKAAEPVMNGWVTDHNNYLKNDGTAYLSPLSFYLKNGFTLCPDVRIATEKLSAVKIMWAKD